MAQFPRLSNREQEVVQRLLEGKSNKQIASSLGISDRTVEFHLKSIYDKFQVASRIELVLKLWNSPDWLEPEKLWHSTVAGQEDGPEDSNGLNSRNWATSLRETISLISQELKVNGFLNAKARNAGDPVTFYESIRVCLTKYAEFNGRASRSEFWWFTLFVTLVASALAYFSETLASVFLIAILLPFLAAGSRRLRDTGKSAWWQLFLLVPVGGLVVLGVLWAGASTSPLPEATPPSVTA